MIFKGIFSRQAPNFLQPPGAGGRFKTPCPCLPLFNGSPWFLNRVHAMSGVLWTGTDLFMGFVIGPIIRGVARPAAGV